MTIRLASLDMAGTTIAEQGTVYAVLRRTVEESTGRQISDELLSRWGGTGKHAAIGGLLSELGEDVSRQDALFEVFKQTLAAEYAADPPTLIPGVRAAVGELRAAGVKVALQTGYSRDVAEPLLETVGWAVGDDIDALVTSDEVPASRPAPFLIFRTMEATGVTDVAQVLTAGDTANDLGAGVAAGARFVVGVTTGAYTAEQLGTHRHTHLLASAAQLPALLRSEGELPS
ncbi:phosphonatase-like hydrolase [Gryllotalpicola ginsengisoli]|uniref:phosphonatase-like hydrolase n=1 Tax=Gryllotalpicola ginsengisoli TaxID=444608 RepID=UPI0003B31E5B|nr:phosphonatase-like hydrolase [Gryllotalpicola ginsengisoli]